MTHVDNIRTERSALQSLTPTDTYIHTPMEAELPHEEQIYCLTYSVLL